MKKNQKHQQSNSSTSLKSIAVKLIAAIMVLTFLLGQAAVSRTVIADDSSGGGEVATEQTETAPLPDDSGFSEPSYPIEDDSASEEESWDSSYDYSEPITDTGEAVDVSTHPLVEVGASDDEPLLSLDELDAGTQALIEAGPAKLEVKKSKSGRRLLAKSADSNDDTPTEGPISDDGKTIEWVTVEWLSHSTGSDEPAGEGTLELETDNATVGNQQFQINFALSGTDDHEPGSVEITFPAYIWLDRYGNEPGELTLSVPEEPGTGADFAWRRVGDNIVITNLRRLSAASKVMIQGTYRNVKPYDMVDKDVSPESDYATAENLGHSNPFSATIGITTPNDKYIALKSNEIDATIDTHVSAASATKSAYNTSSRSYYVYHTVEKATALDGGNMPAEFLTAMRSAGLNPDEYSYARWYASGSATGSQPFHMTVNDTYNGTIIHYLDSQHQQTETLQVAGRLIGVQGALVLDEESGEYKTGNVLSEDGTNVTATIYDGYNTLPKSAYVWTAYKKSDFPVEGDEYRISNTQTVEVTGWDDLIPTTKEATAEAPFRLPVTYHVKKVWNDAGHEDRRPKHQSVLVYYNENLNPLEKKTITAGADNNWTITWDDEGQGWQYKVRELGMSGAGWEEGHEGDDAYLKDGVDNSYSRYSPNFMQVGYSEYSHIINQKYDEDGDLREYDRWWYELEKEEYDSETHTWIKYNKYCEEHVVRTLVPFREQKLEVGIQKTRNNYGDSNLMSTSDRALNVLRRGDDVIVGYNVYGYGYIMELTKGQDVENVDITSFGFRDVKLELEDNYGADTLKDAKDNTLLLDSSIRLTPDDAEVAYVSLSTPTYLHYYQPDKYSPWTMRTLTAADFGDFDRPDEELWGCDAEGNWTRYAVLSIDNNGTLNVTTENGASNGGSQTYINLPEGVWKVKTVMTVPGLNGQDPKILDRRIDGVRMSYNIGIRLRGDSETIQNRLNALFDANDYAMCTLDNYATINVTEQDEEGFATSLDDQSRTWLHGRNHRVAVRQEKSFELVENDLIKRELKLHSTVTMTQQSNILEQNEYWDARNEGLIPSTASGTWYDLLPLGVMPDVESVKLSNGADKITDVYTIENYKGSGRVLLVVKAEVEPHVSYTNSYDPNPYKNDITYPKEGYKDVHTFEFDAYYSWDEARLYGVGTNVRNVAAYEADENALGNINGWAGEPDNPTTNHNQRAMDAVGDDKTLMTGLDPDRPAGHSAFVYSGAILKHEEIDFMAATELRKYVTRDGLGIWTTGRDGTTQATVYEGDYYTYMLYVASDKFTTTKNIILLDNLETYVPAENDSDYGRGRWQGNFDSVDVSELEALGIAPVVYYNTSEVDLYELKGDSDSGTTVITDPNRVYDYLQGNGWTTVKPEDPSTVTAIAVDIRHNKDGSDFELDPEESLFCTVRMRAKIYETSGEATDPFNADPEKRKQAENNDYAFNNVFLGCTQVDPVGDAKHAVINYNYVRVGILPFELKVTKVWDDANNTDGKRPNEIKVHLLANGKRMDPDRTITLNKANDWTGVFAHVIRYDDDGNWINYSFEEESTDPNPAFNLDGYEQRTERQGENVTLTNKHTPEKTQISFTKTWEDQDNENGERPESITVRLMADGVFTGKTIIVKPDRSGNWAGSFTDLPKYSNPEGLSGAQHEIKYSVEEVPVYKYIDEYDTDQETGTITINNKYYPFGNLFVQKNIENFTEVSEGKEFTFTLLLKDQEGNDVTEKFGAFKSSDTSELFLLGNGDTFTLKGSEYIVIADIPSETSYEVIESETPGYTLMSSSNASGSIRAGGAVTFSSFTNRYEAEGSQSLSLFKTLEGRDMGRYQFRFEMVDMTEGSDTFEQVVRTASADADGNAMFSRLQYTEADHGKTFTYQIREVDREKPGYTYDKNTYKVEVTVTDNGDGTMTCTPKYFKADGTVIENPADPENGIVFHNIYKAKGSIALKAWKQLPDGELKDYLPFEFELLQVNTDPESESYKQGSVLQTKPCDTAGTIAFDVLNFTEKDVGKTFLYVIREKEGTDERVVYDEQLRGIELSVADNGDGTLAITQTNVTITAAEQDGTVIYEKGSETTELPVFVNHLEPGNLSVTKLTTWEEKEPDGNAEFPFSLTLVGDELPETIKVALSDGASGQQQYTEENRPTPLTEDEKQEKEVELTITSPENVSPVTGVYEFTLKAGQTLTVKDLPAGVAYQFQETIPPGWTLEFENVAGIVVPQATTAATYTNTYEPGNTVVTILATKRLDGSTPPAQKFAFELVDDTDGSDTKGDVLQTLWNHASGYVLFDLKYSEKGTYHYILREVQGLVESVDSEGNITYSTNEDELRKIEFDENTYGVTVKVNEITDAAGNTTLTANVTYDDGAPPQFKNSTRPGSLQISKVGTGLTDANKDKEFKFKVTLSNDAGMPLTESGNMIWYAQKSDEQAPVAPIPETPEKPENSEPAEIEQTQSVQDPATGRNLMAVRQQLKAAPLSAPLLGAEPSLEDEHGGIDKTGVYGGGNQTVNGIQHGTVTYTLYKDGYLFLKPTNGVSGTFNNSSNPDKSYVASHTKYMVVEETCYAVGSVQDMICSADNIVYADLRGMDVSHATNLVDFLDWSSKLEYLDISTWAVPTNYGGRFLYRSGSLSVIKIGPEFRASSSAFFASPGGNWTCLEKPELGTKTIAELCNGNKAGETYAGTWVRVGYNPNFTIAFDPNGATGNMEPINASIANPPTLPKNTFESDLLFAGWSTDPNAIVPEYEDEATFTGVAVGGQTITLYAIWMSEDSFLLNYDANGGYSRVQWQRVNGPTATVEMPVPTHPNNYEFLYWTTQADGGGDRYSGTVSGADFNAAPGSTIKLYAQYLDPDQRARVTVEHYQQNANLLGYTLSGTDHLGAFDLGATVTPEKKEYTGFIPPTEFRVLSGSDTTGTTQPDGTEVTVVKGGVTIRYYYDRTRYTLVFDANDGMGTMSDMEMVGGVPAKLPVNRFTKENAIFVGWNTKPDGSGTSYGDGQSVNSIGQNEETVTLYAQWFDLDDAQSAEATNGEYIVTCKANETIVFPSLPAGTHYTIEEIDLPDGWTLKGIDNNSGTVLSAERVNVTATNQYSARGYADIIAHKALPGETVREGQFTFELLDENGTVLQTKSNSPTDTMEQTYDSEGNPVPNSYYGTAPVLFDTITYNQQGVYHYQIRETKGTDSAITYDAHIENVTVVVKDRGDGRLVTEVLYDESGANFRNDMSPGNLTVSKTVRNASALAAEKSFTFTVYLFDRNGNEIQDAYPVKLSNGDETTVKSGGAVSIKGDESFTVEGLPHQSRYIVVEVPTDGFELAKKDGDEGTIQAGETSEASFENAYSSRTNAEGGAVIEAKKVFEHGVIQPEQFQFRLSDSSNEEIETVYANPDGTIEFSPIHYTLEDDGKRFVYYIEEVPGEDSGIVYDTHRERVSVTVTDNGDGTMTTEVTYDGETEAQAKEPPTFTNKKKEKSISITKKLIQRNSETGAPHKAEKNMELGFLVYEGELINGLNDVEGLTNAEIAEQLEGRRFLYVPVTVKKGESEASVEIWDAEYAYQYDADSDQFIEDKDTIWEWNYDESYTVLELPIGNEDYKLKQMQIDGQTIRANNQSFVNAREIGNAIIIANEYQKGEPPTPSDGIDTGDHTHTLPYILMMAGAGAVLLAALLIRSRRRKKR